ncbi:hypothetical protein KI387_007977, partial [Taxus chinensis]
IIMWDAPRKPNPPNRPRISPPRHRITLKSPLVNDTCDGNEPKEVWIEEPKEEDVGDDYNYIEVEEVDSDTHNGLIEYIDGYEDDDNEEAPRFSCAVFTHAQSKKGSSSS